MSRKRDTKMCRMRRLREKVQDDMVGAIDLLTLLEEYISMHATSAADGGEEAAEVAEGPINSDLYEVNDGS